MTQKQNETEEARQAREHEAERVREIEDREMEEGIEARRQAIGDQLELELERATEYTELETDADFEEWTENGEGFAFFTSGPEIEYFAKVTDPDLEGIYRRVAPYVWIHI